MARARNIKPGFFKNEILAEVNPLGRLLFAGLWTLADREGRLEDRPKRIKAEILPYDNCDINELLNSLAESDFIQRYEVDGCHYIQINNFIKHQNPHVKESASDIPAPDVHRTSTVQEQDEHRSSPADSLNLVTDSFNPIKDISSQSPTQAPALSPATPYDDIVSLFHEHTPSLPRIQKLTDKRKKAIRARWRASPEVSTFETLFKKAEASDFLSGRNGQWTGCSFDWLMNESNMLKVLEGNYDNKGSPLKGGQQSNGRDFSALYN